MFPVIMRAAPGFAFDVLGSGRINNTTGLSRLLDGRKEMMCGMEADQLQKDLQ